MDGETAGTVFVPDAHRMGTMSYFGKGDGRRQLTFVR